MDINAMGLMIDRVKRRLPAHYRIDWVASFMGKVPTLDLTVIADDPVAGLITERRLASEAGLLREAAWFDAGHVAVSHRYTEHFAILRALRLKRDLAVHVTPGGSLLVDGMMIGEACVVLPQIDRPARLMAPLPDFEEVIRRINGFSIFPIEKY